MQSPALFPSSLLLLLCGSARAFSVPSATAGNAILFQHRLVEHTDQLQQRRQNRDHDHGDSDSDSELVPPPHLFCIPAPGGDVCLVVDENGAYHAVRDACPPLGLPLSQTAVVDSQVNAIGDTMFGTRFELEDGTVRGPWCPGGGTAGPLLLRLARHRRYPRLALFLLALSRRISWMMARVPSRKPRTRRRRWTPLRRPPPWWSLHSCKNATALEVLDVTEQPDGSLTVALPRSSAAGQKEDAGASWAAKYDLAGYEY